MKLTSIILLGLMLLIFNSNSCRLEFSSVPNRIEGTWIRLPYDSSNIERWIFDGDSLNINNNSVDGNYNYTFRKRIKKEYVYIESYLPDSVDRWYIVNVTRGRLDLISELNGIKGEPYRSFWKEN
ncbi:MAG: hypothetical protein IIA45_05350 [Bacteroidetes bacterium]|nr:hypothetical protein [Bacteroidota bacterium]